MAHEVYKVGRSTLYESPEAHPLDHEREEEFTHEQQLKRVHEHEEEIEEEKEEEEHHHHHHAGHLQGILNVTNAHIVSTSPTSTSAPQQLHVLPINTMQEVGLLLNKNNPTVNIQKLNDVPYRLHVGGSLGGDLLMDLDDLQNENENDSVSSFFTKGIWDDKHFQKSVLLEYKDFFDQELYDNQEANKKKKKDDKSTSYDSEFKKVFQKFKSSMQGVMLQDQLERYRDSIERFITYAQSKSSRIQSSLVLQVKKHVESDEKVELVGNEVVLYTISYEGDNESPVFVTERSLVIFLGKMIFKTFVTKQKTKNVIVCIPYDSALSIFNNKKRSFSLGLLRNKIYFDFPKKYHKAKK